MIDKPSKSNVAGGEQMARLNDDFDFSNAVAYHYGKFPPKEIDTAKVLQPLAQAASSLARYDQMLKGMHNSEILLAPLRKQEAVVSSRMEGTVSTLDEVLRYEADQEGDADNVDNRYRGEAVEVFLYANAMKNAQRKMEEGQPLSGWLFRSIHGELLSVGRGASMSPGEYKSEQNYIGDKIHKRISFTPISPEHLESGVEALLKFMDDDSCQILIRTALAHLEFEALHPFKDGNGRIGRMLITLMLWRHKVISAPHFYISAYFEDRRDEYIERMREVSRSDAWSDWIVFFLDALDQQAQKNLAKAEEITRLYGDMKDRFREVLASQWSTVALDFIFSRPVFRNNVFTGKSGIPGATAHRFARTLQDAGLLKILAPAAGRRPALYAFDPLLDIVRAS